MRTPSTLQRVVRTGMNTAMKQTRRTRTAQPTVSFSTLRTQQRLAIRAMASETSSLRPILSIQSNAEPWMPRGWMEGDMDEDDDGT